MQIKGSKYTIFGIHQIPPNFHFASPLAKEKEKEKQKEKEKEKEKKSMKHKSNVMGETIAFSICKPFKPLGLPSGRVRSREGLLGMIPTSILKHYVVDKQ
jgi:hypothetical protein